MAKEFGFKNRQQITLEQVVNNLDSKAKSIISDLENVREKIKNGQLDRLNSLGEVQGRGQDVDIMCSQIRGLLESIEMFDVYDKTEKMKVSEEG